MRVALLVEALGAPHTLASTAFAGALLEGLQQIEVSAQVFGLARTQAFWYPESLGSAATCAPWLSPAGATYSDRWSAAYAGVFDDREALVPSSTDEPGWYLELMLQRELERFAQGDELVLMVYPRSFSLFTTAARIAARSGWRILAFATEALSDTQIDPVTRTDYIDAVVRCADAVWAVSEHLRGFWVANGLPAERILVRPGLIRPSALEVAPSEGSGHSAVYIGNLVHREIDCILDVAGAVRRDVSAFRLDVYGDATLERRTELAARLLARGLQDVVRVHAAVPPSAVPSVLSGADVLLLPRAAGEFSTAGFPNKLGEYLASGRPVVVTTVGDVAKYLTDGEDAFLVEPDDCEAFTRTVVRVLGNRELAASVGAAGRLRADQLLRSDSVARDVLRFVGETPRNLECTPRRAGLSIWSKRLLRAGIDSEATKRGVVRGLRALHLKPPPPSSEILDRASSRKRDQA